MTTRQAHAEELRQEYAKVLEDLLREAWYLLGTHSCDDEIQALEERIQKVVGGQSLEPPVDYFPGPGLGRNPEVLREINSKESQFYRHEVTR